MSRTATKGIDYTSKDYESYRADMLKSLQEKMPEYTDLRESDAGVVIIELLAQGLDVLSLYQDILANEVYIATAEQRENIMKWCSMLGYTPRYATVAKFKQVFELVSVLNTDTLIPKGTLVKTSGSSGEDEVTFETMKDLLIPKGKTGLEKTPEGEYIYTVDVFEGVPVNNELLGSSDGSPNQKYSLKFPKAVLDDTLIVQVDSGYGFETWTRVDNFIEATPYAKQYSVSVDNNDNVIITFGDGVFGKIPPYGKNNIYASYRIGGGSQGNVGINKITELDTSIALVKSTFNPYNAYESGQDKETPTEISRNAPIANRTRWGAITLEDFSDVVVSEFYPKVQWAVSKRDPSNQDNLYIYVMLQGNQPLTEDFKSEILGIFDENLGGRKVIGADKIYIVPPIFTELALNAVLVVDSNYQKDLVKGVVNDYIVNYFIKGNYPFDKEFSYSAFASEILTNIDGVKAFRFTGFTEDVLTPAVGEIYSLKSLSIVATGGEQ